MGISRQMLAAARAPLPLDEAQERSERLEIAKIFHKHADFVWRALRRRGLDAADADDALQEVFLVVHRRYREYEERGAIRAWLYTISRQVAAHYRRTVTRNELKHQNLPEPDQSLETPHDAVERREAVELVNSFLAELDESQATVFCLTEVEGMTAPEVAAVLGVKLNTVYARLRLARRRFEKWVSREIAGMSRETAQ